MGNRSDERLRDVEPSHGAGVSLPVGNPLRAVVDQVSCRDELYPHRLVGSGLVQELVLAIVALDLLIVIRVLA